MEARLDRSYEVKTDPGSEMHDGRHARLTTEGSNIYVFGHRFSLRDNRKFEES